jgi:predicted ThiF/HesA family dinucleotide-utilizing enzyme
LQQSINSIQQRIASITPFLQNTDPTKLDRAAQANYANLQSELQRLQGALTINQQRLQSLSGKTQPLQPLAGPPAPAQVSDKAQSVLTRLANALPAQVNNDQTKAVLQRAQQFGVDPAATLAVYGIESSYGANPGASAKGATGPMQVTEDTFKRMKRWYTDPANIQKYNIPPVMADAARAMVRGTPQGDVDAGLLRLKYNEYIGVPRELWGAAYQSNAEEVRAAGRPLPRTDGNLTNTEYNAVYAGLYNQAYAALTGGAMTPAAQAGVRPAAAPGAAPVAGVAGIQIPGAPAAPAVAAPAVAAATAPIAKAEGVPDQVRTTTNRYLADPQSIGVEFSSAAQQRQIIAQQRDQAARLSQIMRQSATREGMTRSLALDQEVTKYDLMLAQQNDQMLQLMGMQGLMDLRVANDPRRLAGVLSQYTGYPVNLQMRSDGKYNMFTNGQMTQEGIAREGLESMFLQTISAEARKTAMASAVKEREMARKYQYEAMNEREKQLLTTLRETSSRNIMGQWMYNIAQLKDKGIKATAQPDGSILMQQGDQVFIARPTTEGTSGEGFAGFSITPIQLPR